jgi:hypothetical protein
MREPRSVFLLVGDIPHWSSCLIAADLLAIRFANR